MSTPRVRLKYACVSRGKYGLNYPATGYVDQGIRLIRTTDLAGGVLSPAELGIYVPEGAVDDESRLMPGDLLLSRSGTIGRAFLAPPATEGMAFAGFLVRFRPKPDTLGKYIYYCTQSNEFQAAVNADAVSSTIQNFNAEKYENLAVPLPELDEQRAISDYLDRETQKIDELITEQRSLIETLRERRYACIERAVTCGISDAQLGESSIPWIARMPLDWGVSRMKHETAMTTGGTPDTDDLAYWSEASDEAGVPWVAISDMSRRRSVCSTSKRLTPAGVASKRLRIGKAGTILFAMYASVGEVSRLDVDATWNQAILGITPGDRLESGYLAYLLMAMRTFMLGEVRTNTQANLNARQVGDMPLPIPLLEEQREIVDYLDEQTARIDELISESEDLIALSQECRAALITAAVTGQIDVREAA